MPSTEQTAAKTDANTSPADAMKKKKKRKSPSRRRRDQERAATFRARKLVMPFTGKLLPIISEYGNSDEDGTSTSVTPAQPQPPTPDLQVPVKCLTSRTQHISEELGSVKKHLFPPTQVVCQGKPPSYQPFYKQKEDATWSKLFD